uniref:Uncharacterized protein n=1 Tax=Hyaloperonospora arabidopsidis (strain Emoy2) TaxID=559515 RepID=M4BT43_HYAAE
MDDSLAFVSQLGPDSFDSNSLLELHTAWMDNEELNQLPLYMDVEADDSISGAQYLSIDCSKAVENAADQSKLLHSGLNMDLDDHDAQLLDAALELPFDTELSPILEPFADTSAPGSPLRIPRRRYKNNATERKMTDSSSKRTAQVGTTPQVSVLEKSKTGDETALAAVTTPRPRTRSSSWQQQEQNTFFTFFKVKWPLTPKSEPQPSFSSLLLQRFDTISTKIRTKSVIEVRQFYKMVLQNVAAMLQVVDNDVDLTNPDQVRIALWCWSKLMAEKKYRDEFLGFDAAPVKVKTSLANMLLQSIIRSRRQMLKAKSEKSVLNSEASTPSRPSISAWVSRSNLSSFFAGAGHTRFEHACS